MVSDKITDLSVDLLELPLDSVLTDGIVKDIPFISTIYSITKIGFGIRETRFMRTVLKFLIDIKDVSSSERRKFIQKLNTVKSKKRTGEALLHILDSYDDVNKASVLANLIKALVAEKLTSEGFLRLASLVSHTYLPDLQSLHYYARSTEYRIYETDTLLSKGLIYTCLIDGDGNNRYSWTQLGKDMYCFGVSGIYENGKLLPIIPKTKTESIQAVDKQMDKSRNALISKALKDLRSKDAGRIDRGRAILINTWHLGYSDPQRHEISEILVDDTIRLDYRLTLSHIFSGEQNKYGDKFFLKYLLDPVCMANSWDYFVRTDIARVWNKVIDQIKLHHDPFHSYLRICDFLKAKFKFQILMKLLNESEIVDYFVRFRFSRIVEK